MAMRASLPKITVFILAVLIIALFIGSAMYVIEGPRPDTGFTSIPRSMYWAIVTVTTVGFGDITPVTPLGQFLSAVLMLIGYSIIAVPTGIVSAELNRTSKENPISTEDCPACSREGHDPDAKHCKYCGAKL
jgi:voltage-gated potassium channel